MILRIVGSNSSGNGYLLEATDGSQLIIEAGCSSRAFRRTGKMRTADVKAVVISHSHGDHAKYAKDFIKAGIGVHSTGDLRDKCTGVEAMTAGETYGFGDFRVTPFVVEHDVPCFGYLIFHTECGPILFATDCYNQHQVFKGIRHFLIEANYSDDLLLKAIAGGTTPRSAADRIRLSHLSYKNCTDYLQMCNAAASAHTITLIHLSSRHSDRVAFAKGIQEQTGVPTMAAESGMTITLI